MSVPATLTCAPFTAAPLVSRTNALIDPWGVALCARSGGGLEPTYNTAATMPMVHRRCITALNPPIRKLRMVVRSPRPAPSTGHVRPSVNLVRPGGPDKGPVDARCWRWGDGQKSEGGRSVRCVIERADSTASAALAAPLDFACRTSG